MKNSEYRITKTEIVKTYEKYLVKIREGETYEMADLADAIQFAKKFLGKIIYRYRLVITNYYTKNTAPFDTIINKSDPIIKEEIPCDFSEEEIKKVAVKVLTDIAMQYKKEGEKLMNTTGGKIMADLDLRLSDTYFDMANKVIDGKATPTVDNVRTLRELEDMIFKPKP